MRDRIIGKSSAARGLVMFPPASFVVKDCRYHSAIIPQWRQVRQAAGGKSSSSTLGAASSIPRCTGAVPFFAVPKRNPMLRCRGFRQDAFLDDHTGSGIVAINGPRRRLARSSQGMNSAVSWITIIKEPPSHPRADVGLLRAAAGRGKGGGVSSRQEVARDDEMDE